MLLAIKRGLIVLAGLLIQFGISIYFQFFLNEYVGIFSVLYSFLGLVLILGFVKNSTRLSNDLPWIILIAIFPLFGTILFITLGRSYSKSRLLKSILQKNKEYASYLDQEERLEDSIWEENDDLQYFQNYAHYPITTKNKIDYYKMGELFYPELLKELKKAEKFIFMEYFIINKGAMWDGILQILKEKAQNGVEVRIMYDDMGSVALLPPNYQKELKQYHIKCIPFNQLSPFSGIMMNNRDHRKMTIIDGKVAFSGGVNISDEYINVTHPFGLWKDNGIKIVGEAVWNLTVMFLTLWNANRQEDEDILKYKYDFDKEDIPSSGFVVPYGNDPSAKNFIGEDVYLNLINGAKKYVYIYTPYLIIDTDMINSLTRASRRGVDVRLVVPGIPDKKLVYSITKSFFPVLMKDGVKIYTYTPGFVHSKVFVADDKRAVVGTLNMDYRSLYLHFENGIYMENVPKIADVKADLLEAFAESHLIEENEMKTRFFTEIWQGILRLFAPMM